MNSINVKSAIRAVLDQVSNVAGPIVDLLVNHEEQKREALNAISSAIHGTYLYYEDYSRTLVIDRARQKSLVELWRVAANVMAPVDQELAEACRLKATYWISPMNYDHDEQSRITMDLDRVNDQYRKLLVPRVVKKEAKTAKKAK